PQHRTSATAQDDRRIPFAVYERTRRLQRSKLVREWMDRLPVDLRQQTLPRLESGSTAAHRLSRTPAYAADDAPAGLDHLSYGESAGRSARRAAQPGDLRHLAALSRLWPAGDHRHRSLPICDSERLDRRGFMEQSKLAQSDGVCVGDCC